MHKLPERDRYRNRTKRQRVLIPIACAADGRSLRVGVLNVRSLGNKAATVSDMIVYNLFDLFAVVESWHDSAKSPSVIASTPPGYRVFERSRTRTKAMSLATNHGGVCVFVRHGIQFSVIDTPLSKTFESLLLSVRDGVQSFAFVVL